MTPNLQQPPRVWADTLDASTLSIIELSPKALKPLGRKVRIHPQQQIDQLVESFRAFGFAVPVIVDESDRVIAGNARVEAAIQAGLTKIPAVRLETLDAQQKRAFALAENKLSSLAKWDKAELNLELRELLSFESSFSINVTGFSLEVARKDAPCIRDAPSVTEGDGVITVSRAGDVWALGRHRLICGAGASPSAIVEKGRRAKLVFAPPSGLHNTGTKFNASLSLNERDSGLHSFKSLMDKNYTLFVTSPLSELHQNLDVAFKSRLQLVATIVVVSEHVGSAAIRNSMHDLVVGFQIQQRSSRSGAFVRDPSTIRPSWWDAQLGSAGPLILRNVDAPSAGGVPLMLRKELISEMTKEGDVIMDYLANDTGSLVVAEETGRMGLLVQTNLNKVDILIKDWEAGTGKQATHVITNQTFAQTSTDRFKALVEKPGFLPPARARSRRAAQEMMHV